MIHATFSRVSGRMRHPPLGGGELTVELTARVTFAQPTALACARLNHRNNRLGIR